MTVGGEDFSAFQNVVKPATLGSLTSDIVAQGSQVGSIDKIRLAIAQAISNLDSGPGLSPRQKRIYKERFEAGQVLCEALASGKTIRIYDSNRCWRITRLWYGFLNSVSGRKGYFSQADFTRALSGVNELGAALEKPGGGRFAGFWEGVKGLGRIGRKALNLFAPRTLSEQQSSAVASATEAFAEYKAPQGLENFSLLAKWGNTGKDQRLTYIKRIGDTPDFEMVTWSKGGREERNKISVLPDGTIQVRRSLGLMWNPRGQTMTLEAFKGQLRGYSPVAEGMLQAATANEAKGRAALDAFKGRLMVRELSFPAGDRRLETLDLKTNQVACAFINDGYSFIAKGGKDVKKYLVDNFSEPGKILLVPEKGPTVDVTECQTLQEIAAAVGFRGKELVEFGAVKGMWEQQKEGKKAEEWKRKTESELRSTTVLPFGVPFLGGKKFFGNQPQDSAALNRQAAQLGKPIAVLYDSYGGLFFLKVDGHSSPTPLNVKIDENKGVITVGERSFDSASSFLDQMAAGCLNQTEAGREIAKINADAQARLGRAEATASRQKPTAVAPAASGPIAIVEKLQELQGRSQDLMKDHAWSELDDYDWELASGTLAEDLDSELFDAAAGNSVAAALRVGYEMLIEHAELNEEMGEGWKDSFVGSLIQHLGKDEQERDAALYLLLVTPDGRLRYGKSARVGEQLDRSIAEKLLEELSPGAKRAIQSLR